MVGGNRAVANLPEHHVFANEIPARCVSCRQFGKVCSNCSLPRRWGIVPDYCPMHTSERTDIEMLSQG